MDEVELLTDEQYLAFLTDGYVELHPRNLAAADHALLYEKAGGLYAKARSVASPTVHLDILGDNVRAQVPEIDRMLTDPVVDGALTSVLGPDYLLHPHHYCHRSEPEDQTFHQDGNLPWNERGHYRSHRPDWAMLFYYPQDVDETNGPTEVVPGSQYWTVDNEKPSGEWHAGDRIDRSIDDSILSDPDLELRDQHQTDGLACGLGIPGLERVFLHVPAGTVLLAHYDLIHRGSRVAGNPDARYMYKFYFARVREPVRPSWAFNRPTSTGPDLSTVPPPIVPVVDTIWRWSAGDDGIPDWSVDSGQLDAVLVSGREDEKVDAAYRLARAARSGNDEALLLLDHALAGEAESTRRAAGIGLRTAGASAVPSLLQGLASAQATTRRPAVAGLATAAAARSSAAIEAVVQALGSDPDDLVRSNAAYTLGQIARSLDRGAAGSPGGRPSVITSIVEALLERLEPGAEPDNAFGASFARSTVRQSAAFGLALVLLNHRLPDELIDRIAQGPLSDPDRYVRGLVAEGLARDPGGRRDQLDGPPRLA